FMVAFRNAKVNVNIAYPEWARLDAETRGLPMMIRSSVHYYNTPKEVARFCRIVSDVIDG
ncbi:MAG TPA: aminotransferase, partial [Bacteroidetes bacterium]|nr:aminotransferase [Bacteroidota bacterium]